MVTARTRLSATKQYEKEDDETDFHRFRFVTLATLAEQSPTSATVVLGQRQLMSLDVTPPGEISAFER